MACEIGRSNWTAGAWKKPADHMVVVAVGKTLTFANARNDRQSYTYFCAAVQLRIMPIELALATAVLEVAVM